MAHFGIQPHARRRERQPELAYHYLAHTKPNCEAYATRFLVADKLTVYYPRVMQRIVHAGRVTHAPRPLFARYMFILDEGRGSFYFRSAPGMAGVVGFGGEAVRVGQSVIDRIKQRENADGYIELEEVELYPTTTFGSGEKVRLGAGRLMGFDAVFERKLAGDRAAVFISLMGRLSRTIVEFSDLEKM